MAFDPLSLQIRVAAPLASDVRKIAKDIETMLNNETINVKIKTDGIDVGVLKQAKTELSSIKESLNAISNIKLTNQFDVDGIKKMSEAIEGANKSLSKLIEDLNNASNGALKSFMDGVTERLQTAKNDAKELADAVKQVTQATKEQTAADKAAEQQAKSTAVTQKERENMIARVKNMMKDLDFALTQAHPKADTTAIESAKRALEDYLKTLQDASKEAKRADLTQHLNNATNAIKGLRAETAKLTKEDKESASQAKKDAKERASAIKALSERIAKLRSEMTRAKDSFGVDKSKLKGIEDLVNKMQAYLDKLKQMPTGAPDNALIGAFKGDASTALKQITDLINEQKRLDHQLQGTSQSIDRQAIAEQNLSNAMRAASQAASQQSHVLSDLRNMAAQYVSVWSVANFVKDVAQVTGELELQRKSLEVIIGSAEKAGELYGEIRNLSQQSPYTFQDLIKSTRQLAAFGVQTKDLYSTMKSLSDIGAGLSVDVSRLILAYGHVKSYGYLSGIQNRQFETAGIDMVGALADRYNKLAREAAGANAEIQKVTRQDVFKKMRNKEISFEDVNAVIMDLDKPGGKFYNMQERQFETLGGKLRNLRNNYNIMLSEIGEDHKGVLMGGVEMINGITAGWERWAAVLKGILIPLGAVKVANLALGGSFSKQWKAMEKNLVGLQREANMLSQYERTVTRIGGIKTTGFINKITAPFKAFGYGVAGGWQTLTGKNKFDWSAGNVQAYMNTLGKGFQEGTVSRGILYKQLMNKELPTKVRLLSSQLLGLDKATRNLLFGMSNAGKVGASFARAMVGIGSAINGVASSFMGFFASNAPLLAVMALVASIMDFKRQMEEAEQTARKFGEQGAQDRKEFANVLKTYTDRPEVNTENIRSALNGGYRRTFNRITVDKERLKGVDLSSDIEELKQKLQGMSPIYDFDLINIEKLEDQRDQFEALLNKVESLRRSAEAKEATANYIEGTLKNTGAFLGDTLLEDMQDWVNTINSARAHVLDLEPLEIGAKNMKVGYQDKKGKYNFYLDYIQDQYQLGSQQEALLKLIDLYGDGQAGLDRMRKSMEDFLDAGKKNGGISKLYDDFSELEDIVSNNRFLRSETWRQWNEIMKNAPKVSKDIANNMKTMFGKNGRITDENIDASTDYAYSSVNMLLSGIKGMGENERMVLTNLFVEAIAGSFGDSKVADSIRDAFRAGLVDSDLIGKALKDVGITGDTEVTEADKEAAKAKLRSLFDTKLSDDKAYADMVGSDVEGMFKLYLEKLEGEANKMSVKQAWKKALLAMNDGDNKIEKQVVIDYKTEIRGFDDVEKAIEAGKKKFKDLKQKVEDKKDLITNTIGYQFNLETFWAVDSNLDDLIKKAQAKIQELKSRRRSMMIGGQGDDKTGLGAIDASIQMIEKLLKDLVTIQTWTEGFDAIGVDLGQKAAAAAAKKVQQEQASAEREKKKQENEEKRRKKKEELEKKKAEAEEKRRKAKELREQNAAARKADNAERERQRALNDLLRSRLSLIKQMLDEYNEYKKVMSDDAAWKKIQNEYREYVSGGLLTDKDLKEFRNIYELFDEIHGQGMAEFNATAGRKYSNGDSAHNTTAADIARQALSGSYRQARADMREQSEILLSQYKNTVDEIQRKWELYFSILNETADYALASELSGMSRIPGSGNKMAWQSRERMSESLMWQAIQKLENARSNAVANKVNLVNPSNIDFERILGMDKEELNDYVRNELLNYNPTEGLEQAEKNYTSYMKTLTEALQDFITQSKKEQDDSIREISKTVGESNSVQAQIDKITKDYQERRIKINGNMLPENRGNIIGNIFSLLTRDRGVKENQSVLSGIFSLGREYKTADDERKKEIEKELIKTIGDYMVEPELIREAMNFVKQLEQKASPGTDRANAMNDARYAYELAKLGPQFYDLMNAWKTMSKDTVVALEPVIRKIFTDAFNGEQIGGEELATRLGELSKILYENRQRTGSATSAIWERVGNPLFNPRNENNRELLDSWRGRLGNLLDAEQGKKAEQRDNELITVINKLLELIGKIMSGTATAEDFKNASLLGGAVDNWSNTDRKKAVEAANKESGKGKKRLVDIIKDFEPELSDAMEKIVDALEKIQAGLTFATDFFDSLGMEGMANTTKDASTILGGALGGASALSSLGPYGMAAGAALGLVSGIAKAGDERRERQIQKLREDVQKIDNTLNLIKNLREKTLGYDTGQRRRELSAMYANRTHTINWLGKDYEVGASASEQAMRDYYLRGGTNGNGYVQELTALKKQRQDYLDMYDKENGKKKKSQESLEEYRTKVAELDIQIMEFTQDLANELWSIDIQGWASQIGDALMTAFENGTNAASAFRDSVQDIMKSVVKSMMIKGIIEPMFEDLQERLFGSNGVFDIEDPEGSMGRTLAVLNDFFKNKANGMINAAQEFYNGANDVMKQTLGYGMDAKDSSKNLSNSITSTTSEETMGIVAGYLARLGQDVSVNRLILTGFVNESWPNYIELVTNANGSLSSIDRHTEQIMVMMQDGQGALFDRVERISRRLDNFANGNDRVHTA